MKRYYALYIPSFIKNNFILKKLIISMNKYMYNDEYIYIKNQNKIDI